MNRKTVSPRKLFEKTARAISQEQNMSQLRKGPPQKNVICVTICVEYVHVATPTKHVLMEIDHGKSRQFCDDPLEAVEKGGPHRAPPTPASNMHPR